MYRNEFISFSEASVILEVTPSTIKRWMDKGCIPYTRVGEVRRMTHEGFELLKQQVEERKQERELADDLREEIKSLREDFSALMDIVSDRNNIGRALQKIIMTYAKDAGLLESEKKVLEEYLSLINRTRYRYSKELCKKIGISQHNVINIINKSFSKIERSIDNVHRDNE